MTKPGFVKSATTGTSVDSSRAELNKVLSRYGCTAFGYDQDDETGITKVTFRVPDSLAKDAPKVPVQLEVRVHHVYERLYGKPRRELRWDAATQKHVETGRLQWDPKQLAQAERVAWRHLILWVDAACTAAAAGMTTMREAFHANVLVRDEHGRVGRLFDYVQGQLDAPAGPRLLTSGGGDG